MITMTTINGKKETEKEIPDILKENFEELKEFLKLSENWDNQGSIPINEKTLNPTKFIVKNLIEVMSDFSMPIPDIGAVPNGSIDIYFKTDFYKIVINIPADLNDYIEIYGKTINHELPKLDIMTKNSESIHFVIREWLKKIL